MNTIPNQQKKGCTTEDGVVACSANGACGCSDTPPTRTTWQKIRGMTMFGVACLTSPCCTPLVVPLVLSLAAGTPLAVWANHHLGLVYGGLTLLSVVSLGIGLRWFRQSAQPDPISPSNIPVFTGEKSHVR